MFRRRGKSVRREQALASFDLPDQRITYLLKRSSARRGMALRVNAQGQAQVNAPLAMPVARVEAFLTRHADWLREQLLRQPARLAWRDGMVLPYLGGELRLDLDAAAVGTARVLDGRLIAGTEPAVLAWYRGEAARLLAERLDATCRRLGLALPPWRLSNARTRWGSLSVKGVVGLNWRLVKASVAEIDYVICHELAHLRHRDHSAAYWREVARLCPGYETARARLRENGRRYLDF